MPAQKKRLRLTIACMAVSVSLLAGCATSNNPRDPFESFNRGVYSFNENLDKAILKPTAEAYRAVLPQFIRSSVSNFFSNINDVVVALNNLLQGKFTDAYSDLGRVAINSTVAKLCPGDSGGPLLGIAVAPAALVGGSRADRDGDPPP